MIVRLSLLRKTILIPEYLAFMCVCVFVDGCISANFSSKLSVANRTCILVFNGVYQHHIQYHNSQRLFYYIL